MHALSIQFSGLIGALTLVSQLTSDVALEPSIYRGLGAAVAVLLIMLICDLAIWAIARSNKRPQVPPVAPSQKQGLEERAGALAA